MSGTPASLTESLMQQLWAQRPEEPAAEVYAVLDGARDRRVHRFVLDRGLEQRCLYAGTLAPELVQVAPYLVRLCNGHADTRALLELAWGNHWGIFLKTAAPMEELRLHLRKFLRVKDEQGRRLLFRYYDPRVLRGYLPTCNLFELGFIFGPVRCFYAEAEPAESVLVFSHDGAGLAQEALLLTS